MPFDLSDERSLLKSMVADRDAQIASLTHQLHSTTDALREIQREVTSRSVARKQQREEHSTTISKLKDEHTEQRRLLAKYESSIKSTSGAGKGGGGGGGLRIHEYTALMRSANSSQVESSYVLGLQAQLCRAMHGLGVMESQLALVKENCSGLIKYMKEDLCHMVDERTCREIELMNTLAKADSEKRAMAQDMEVKIREREELLDQVREEYEELGLEYNEDQVKCALEVRYLLEQMEKVKEDEVRVEKELLAALIEREAQIQKLKNETSILDEKYNNLMREDEMVKKQRSSRRGLFAQAEDEEEVDERMVHVIEEVKEEEKRGDDSTINPPALPTSQPQADEKNEAPPTVTNTNDEVMDGENHAEQVEVVKDNRSDGREKEEDGEENAVVGVVATSSD